MKNTTKTYKYTPKTNEELKKLVEDESIYLGDIDTSHIADMSKLFYESERKDFSGIESWDVSNVKNMNCMFLNVKFFDQPLESWDVSNVEDMSHMFCGALSFNQPLNSWNVGKVKDMGGMFSGASSFNQPLDSWDVSNVEYMEVMFCRAVSFNQPLDSWNVGKVKDMNHMFEDTESFNQPLESWNVANVKSMWMMFRNAKSFNQPLDSWNVGNVRDMSRMFEGASSFNQNLESWQVKENVNKIGIFEGSGLDKYPTWLGYKKDKTNGKYIAFTRSGLKDLIDSGVNLGLIDTSHITDMSELFKNSERKDFSGIESWDVSNVKDMTKMFYGAKSFSQNLESWSVAKDTKKEKMFVGSALHQYPSWLGFSKPQKGAYGKYTPKTNEELCYLANDENIYLGNINTSHITDMSRVFEDSERDDFRGIERWNVSNVKNMDFMFYGVRRFKQRITSWKVENVESMRGMFKDAESFNQSLDSWQVRQDADTHEMFKNSGMTRHPKWLESKNGEQMKKYIPNTREDLERLVGDESIYLGDIDTSRITDMSYLFECSARKDFRGIETWDVSNVEDMSWMFSGANSFNQPLDSWDVGNVENMSYMFQEAKSFNQPLNSWRVNNVWNMDSMFSFASSFNQPLESWDVSNVWNLDCMFYGAKAFNQNLNSWRVAKKDTESTRIFFGTNITIDRDLVILRKECMFVGSGMSEYPKWLGFPKLRKGTNGKYTPLSRDELVHMIYDESIYLGDINTSHITDMSRLFYYSQRKDFSGIESWDVSNVEDMSDMFQEASSFNQPLNSWDVSNVKNMSCMFAVAQSFNQPLDSWNVSNVEDMNHMFSSATSFNQPLDTWDVGNVRDMSGMFSFAKAFNQPLDKWNVSKVEDMRRMFHGAKAFNQNLDSWQVKKGANTEKMFENSGMTRLPKWLESKKDK